MKERNTTKRIIDLSVIIVSVWILIIPAVLAFFMVPDAKLADPIKFCLVLFGPLIALFYLNYFILCPKLFYVKKRKVWFFIINIILIFGWRLYKIFGLAGTSTQALNLLEQYTDNAMGIFYTIRWGITFYHQFIVIIQCLVVTIALAIYNVGRNADMKAALEKQKRNAAEAELSWLKSQLNPHFLFNTLNNISSLAAIDSEKTQDSIAQLSDLLRYVLYESNKQSVPLSSEIAFMKDYIDLMKLRCNDKAKIEVDLNVPDTNKEVAPLLFISLIENAFKHGVNARVESFINVKMTAEDSTLCFICENSINEKQKTDMIGSGIGIQNMQKRLDLIYPGRYEFKYGANEQRYVATLKINDIFV